MPPESEADSLEREEQATKILCAKGWRSLKDWLFMAPCGSIHDLSAADISQADRIQSKGLFLAV